MGAGTLALDTKALSTLATSRRFAGNGAPICRRVWRRSPKTASPNRERRQSPKTTFYAAAFMENEFSLPIHGLLSDMI